MKKPILLCMLIFAVAAASAQPSDKFNGALLWRISGNGLGAPSYILGTHHLYALDFFDTIPGARQALENSGQVVGELLLADQQALAAQIQLAAMMPEGVTYESLLSETDYKTLDEGLRAIMGVGLKEQFGAFKPGMISTLLSLVMFAKAYPEFDATRFVGMDAYIQTYAAEKGRPVIGLESVEDQIYALFDAEPLKIQAEQLACQIANMDYAETQLKKLGELYPRGDLAAMYIAGFADPDDPCPASEQAQNALARERNDKWLEKLPSIMSAAPSFIAVGALHLAGEEGLLFQLDKMGYKVEAVR